MYEQKIQILSTEATQLSFYNTPIGSEIHTQTLPIFVGALDEQEQDIKRAGLEGLENLGPFAVSAIPDVQKKLSDPDPVIQKDAQETLDVLEKFNTNSVNAARTPN